jgi:lysylphosphatidylglycerol synthetase-like protein (DUF2156 family)
MYGRTVVVASSGALAGPIDLPQLLDPPDLLDVTVPVGGRALIVADLHLTGSPTAAQISAAADLAASIEASTGPGVLVIAGNLFEGGCEPGAALAAHPRLAADILAYSRGHGRRVIALPGDRDSELAWSEPCRSDVKRLLGAEIALAVDLNIDTRAGSRKVRAEPGHNLDSLSRFEDPRNPRETPFAQHIRGELLPSVRRKQTGSEATGPGWLSGMELLDDPAALSRFIGSRLVYRRLAHSGWLLLVPIVVAFALGLPSSALRSARHGGLTTRLGLFVLAAFLELLVLLAVVFVAIRRTDRALSALDLNERGQDPNEPARARARDLITAGHAGLVTGHTCRPELAFLGPGFYANAGATAEVVTEYPSRAGGLGLPSVFLGHRLMSWVELEAGNDLHVRLLHARQDLAGSTFLERLVARRPSASGPEAARPQVVATFPQGDPWPRVRPSEKRDRQARRIAASIVVVVGFLSLVSALSDPFRDRLDILRELFPLYIPETAAALAALGGVGLIVLARGIRRGQRRAWLVCQILLLTIAVLHLIKGVDVEVTLVALGVAAYLWVQRASFQAKTDVLQLRRGVTSVVAAALLTGIAGALAVQFSVAVNRRNRRSYHISWARAIEASFERMIGFTTVALPQRLNEFFTPAMVTASVGLTLALLVVLFRPVVRRHQHAASAAATVLPAVGVRPGPGGNGSGPVATVGGGLARARAVVAAYGSGTLDYFALRPDKDFFFWGESLVAFGVYGGVCLVSPDPIGPVAEREDTWRAFRRYVDEQGWALGGLGAGEEWLPIYRASGMHDLYAGDEGVVRTARFALDGGRFKGLRQAVNRVAKYGYRITFHDPAHISPDLRSQLTAVMTKSRRGDAERGFSMTLGRAFDPEDADLLLAVVHAPAPPDSPDGTLGPPVAFCQYVPAPGIGGYSLDLMRRDDGDHPNGIIDFAVVETIKELRARGAEGLGLNFATMRAVLAGEAGEGLTQRVQAWALRRMGDSMQIESLWKFNAKFDPDWQPRYAIYDAPENLFGVAIAVARAESFWELPVIGRFLVPTAPRTSVPGA